MNSTIHKWVCNVNAVPNPTQYTKFYKYEVKTQQSGFVRKLPDILNYRAVFFLYFCRWPRAPQRRRRRWPIGVQAAQMPRSAQYVQVCTVYENLCRSIQMIAKNNKKHNNSLFLTNLRLISILGNLFCFIKIGIAVLIRNGYDITTPFVSREFHSFVRYVDFFLKAFYKYDV